MTMERPNVTSRTFPLPEGMESGAHFAPKPGDPSQDRYYRYELWRRWDPNKPIIMFIMMNPSAADHDVDDVTVYKCRRYAERWGFGELIVCNLFPVCCTDSKQLKNAPCVTGHGNLGVIGVIAKRCEKIICAWGKPPTKRLQEQRDIVRDYLIDGGFTLHVLKLNKDGHPAHPLYLPESLEPFVWEVNR